MPRWGGDKCRGEPCVHPTGHQRKTGTGTSEDCKQSFMCETCLSRNFRVECKRKTPCGRQTITPSPYPLPPVGGRGNKEATPPVDPVGGQGVSAKPTRKNSSTNWRKHHVRNLSKNLCHRASRHADCLDIRSRGRGEVRESGTGRWGRDIQRDEFAARPESHVCAMRHERSV